MRNAEVLMVACVLLEATLVSACAACELRIGAAWVEHASAASSAGRKEITVEDGYVAALELAVFERRRDVSFADTPHTRELGPLLVDPFVCGDVELCRSLEREAAQALREAHQRALELEPREPAAGVRVPEEEPQRPLRRLQKPFLEEELL